MKPMSDGDEASPAQTLPAAEVKLPRDWGQNSLSMYVMLAAQQWSGLPHDHVYPQWKSERAWKWTKAGMVS